jgi:hypothetical protein
VGHEQDGLAGCIGTLQCEDQAESVDMLDLCLGMTGEKIELDSLLSQDSSV